MTKNGVTNSVVAAGNSFQRTLMWLIDEAIQQRALEQTLADNLPDALEAARRRVIEELAEKTGISAKNLISWIGMTGGFMSPYETGKVFAALGLNVELKVSPKEKGKV